ncbi:MAG: tetratricopeptide repeat protein [Deltaproteobacteria bacterium]|nr:tetratricopeptide repeat protein [Deltaproteobacteria bacterium]MBI4795139.1 tetratricopeptide repeat protein [Deltaproteobacteria bacterium]
MQEIERCCQILGLEKGASLKEVKQAYRDLVHVWHPDRFVQNPRLQKKAEAMLKEINAAYEKLLASPQPMPAPAKGNKPPSSPNPASPESRDRGSRGRAKTGARQAILGLKKMVRQHPQDPEAHYYLGMAYLHLDRNLEALETLQKAVSLDPRSAAAHLGRGVACSRLGRDLQAVEAFRLAVALKPDDPLSYLNLGITYRRLGRHRRGMQSIIQAIRLMPDYPEAHYELGLANLSLKNRASALEEYKILMKLDSKLAQKLFGQIYQ